jgi:dedicated sortase system histidine kinase
LSLRRQLLLVSLLLLALPWAGCQFVREIEGALRQGQEQGLEATAQAVAAMLSQHEELIYPYAERRYDGPGNQGAIFAPPMEEPLFVDGYADGWEEYGPVELVNPDSDSALAISYRAVTRNGNLYLLLQVQDPEVTYHNPGISREPNGDRLILRTWQEGSRQEYVIATVGPGSVRAQAASRRQRGVDASRIRGFWQDAIAGYTLELEIPLSFTGGRLGFYLLSPAPAHDQPVQTVGNVTPLEIAAPPWLISQPPGLKEALLPFQQSGHRIAVIDQQHWALVDLPPVNGHAQNDNGTFWLLRLLYRSVLLDEESLQAPPQDDKPGQASGAEIDAALGGLLATTRHQVPNHRGRTLLSSAAPVVHENIVTAAVVVSQSGEQYLSLTDRAFSRLLGYSMVALGLAALGLLGYASLLSWRIGRLSRAAQEVIQDDGLLLDNFPRSPADDEIGQLSRHYGDLLDRLREHQDYLRGLSRKLSHELRTPIAVIQTSLENLQHNGTAEAGRDTYLQRAHEGLERLSHILTAMSEASGLEDSIRNNVLENTDLVPLLREVFGAYQALYTDHTLSFECEPASAHALITGDLLVQALDKLMDNAATFCPAGGRISLGLHWVESGWEISVSNQGPPLPEHMRSRLFEPMVSLRESGSDQVHLGLGLHVVRLIADYFEAQVTADNLPDGSGVRFVLTLPSLGE